MIKDIKINNFCGLSNFNIQLKHFQSFSNKNLNDEKIVLDGIINIQKLLRNGHTEDIFSSSTLSTSSNNNEQTFFISIINENKEDYEYKLIIEYINKEKTPRIKYEELKWNNSPIYLFDEKNANLFRIDEEGNKVIFWKKFSIPSTRSGILNIPYRFDNYPIKDFLLEIEKILIVQPIYSEVKDIMKKSSHILSKNAKDFSQWYSHILLENPKIGYLAKKYISRILPSFENLCFTPFGDNHNLTAVLKISGGKTKCVFSKLSKSVQQIIILYTVIASFHIGFFSTFLICHFDNSILSKDLDEIIKTIHTLSNENKQSMIILD